MPSRRELANAIRAHPMALLFPERVKSAKVQRALAAIDATDVRQAYRRWAPVYDHTFGSFVEAAVRQVTAQANRHTGRLIEVGVGTGLALPHYAPSLRVTGIDLSPEMLARAHAAEPENGNVQDSLGWAQFRQGQYDIAVETLEGAVSKEPANAEINDHLGDAYWQVGRRREAQWQWNRVLTLEPDAERRAEVEQKLANGLSIAPPVSVGQP